MRRARIYTLDAARSWAEALAVRGGRLVHVGSDSGARPYIGPRTRVVDAAMRLVLPGFHDAHAHLWELGRGLDQCDLGYPSSVPQTIERIAACAQKYRDRGWLVGLNYNQTLFPALGPGKLLLDSLVPAKPAVFYDAGLHSVWVNSRALATAEITRDTPDPPNGRIERDPATGEPWGTLRETAVRLVTKHVPAPTEKERVLALSRALDQAARLGLVSVQDASTGAEWLPAFAELARTGSPIARLRLSLVSESTTEADGEKEVARFAQWRATYASERLALNTVKISVDGVFDARTSALLRPYSDSVTGVSPDSGRANYTPEQLVRLVRRFDREGFQVHMHATGDRAVRMGLDAIAEARRTNGIRDARHTIAHLHLIDPQDVPRFSELGVVANIQPGMADGGPYNLVTLPGLLGAERMRRLHQFRTLMESGALVAVGSDAPVVPLDPLQGIEVALTRREVASVEGNVLNPEERVDLPRILAAHTIASAYAGFLARESGSIEVGKHADFIMLDKDLFRLPAHEIHTARVLWTVVEGRDAYRAEGWR